MEQNFIISGEVKTDISPDFCTFESKGGLLFLFF